MDEAYDEPTIAAERRTVEVTVTVTVRDTLMSEEDASNIVMRAMRLQELCGKSLPELAERLIDPRPSRDDKHFATAWTLMKIVDEIDLSDEGACHQALLNLWAPTIAKQYTAWMRGKVASAVAVLRAAEMENAEIEMWLDKEIKVHILDFTSTNAIRWFYDYSRNDKTKMFSETDMYYFDLYRPKIGQTLTEAKQEATARLKEVRATKIGPLVGQKRRG